MFEHHLPPVTVVETDDQAKTTPFTGSNSDNAILYHSCSHRLYLQAARQFEEHIGIRFAVQFQLLSLQRINPCIEQVLNVRPFQYHLAVFACRDDSGLDARIAQLVNERYGAAVHLDPLLLNDCLKIQIFAVSQMTHGIGIRRILDVTSWQINVA